MKKKFLMLKKKVLELGEDIGGDSIKRGDKAIKEIDETIPVVTVMALLGLNVSENSPYKENMKILKECVKNLEDILLHEENGGWLCEKCGRTKYTLRYVSKGVLPHNSLIYYPDDYTERVEMNNPEDIVEYIPFMMKVNKEYISCECETCGYMTYRDVLHESE